MSPAEREESVGAFARIGLTMILSQAESVTVTRNKYGLQVSPNRELESDDLVMVDFVGAAARHYFRLLENGAIEADIRSDAESPGAVDRVLTGSRKVFAGLNRERAARMLFCITAIVTQFKKLPGSLSAINRGLVERDSLVIPVSRAP